MRASFLRSARRAINRFVQGVPDKEDRAAEWDVDSRTILVGRRLAPVEKRGAFLREEDHAWRDWELWVSQQVPVKYPDAMDPTLWS